MRSEQGYDADVIIVGGGPSGATLGCLLAQGGHRALIIERQVHPREHIGEALTPSVNKILHRIGLLARMDEVGFVRRMAIHCTWPQTPERPFLSIPVAEHPPPRALRTYGYNVERDSFDAMLINHARATGVKVLEEATARRVLFEHNRATGIEVQQHAGTIQILKGRFIVDASGRACLLGRQRKLMQRDARLQQCAIYTWFQNAIPGKSDHERLTCLHFFNTRKTWAWEIPLSGGIVSVGVVAPCKSFSSFKTNPGDFFNSVIESNQYFRKTLHDVDRVRSWQTTGDYSYQLGSMTGLGWLLIGDASGFIDPIFSSGVDIAMYTAAFAYEALLPLLLLDHWSDSDEKFALTQYEFRVRQGIGVWSKAAELFYKSPRSLLNLARNPRNIPSICRFLQGNPYEIQNQLIFERLLAVAEVP